MADLASLLALLGVQGGQGIPGVGNIPQGNPLDPNLAAQTQSQLPPTQAPPQQYTDIPETVTPDMEVTAPRKIIAQNPRYSMDDTSLPDGPTMIPQAGGDTSPLPRSQASPQELAGAQNFENLPGHKGMFGVKGTLRDILGTLGDAFLTQAGHKSVYAPQKEQEQLSDAMVGFGGQDPDAQLAILRRVAQVNPEAASQLQQQMQTQQFNQQKLQAAQGQASQKSYKDGAELYANALRGMTQQGQYNPRLLDAIAKRYNLDPELYTPPPAYDRNWAEPFMRQTTPVNQQETREQSAHAQDLRERQQSFNEGKFGQQQDLAERRLQADLRQRAAGLKIQAANTGISAARVGQQQEAETGRNNRYIAGRIDAAIARTVKNNPGATIQKNATTGKVRFSTDGGKTWQMAN